MGPTRNTSCHTCSVLNEDLRRYWSPVRNECRHSIYAYFMKLNQLSFYFGLKGFVFYLCFKNKLLVRSMKYLILYSGLEITLNGIIFPMGKINFIMQFLAIQCTKNTDCCFSPLLILMNVLPLRMTSGFTGYD